MLNNRHCQPYAGSALARYLNKRIYELRGVKTQREIALAAGFARPNIISMFKTGETKVPLDRIVPLARALDTDPAHLLRLAMVDQQPELAQVIDDVFGRQMASQNEADIFLTKWRAAAATGNMDPAPNARIDGAVNAMLAGLFMTPSLAA
jgi:hypothetical protein